MPDRALLIGINQYENVPALRGCVNDVADARDLLLGTLGWPEAGIRTLTDSDAVRANVLDGLRWLVDGATPKDRLYLHISGHGSYDADRDGDEADGFDELACLHDMQWGDPRTYILDDEWRGFAEHLPVVKSAIVVLDTCHSGTGLRAIEPPGSPRRGPVIDLKTSLARAGAARALPPGQALKHEVLARFAAPPPEIVAEALRRGQPKPKRRIAREVPKRSPVLLIAACRPDQTAADAWFPPEKGGKGKGLYQGAHTRAVCAAFRKNPKVAPKALETQLARAMKAGRFEQIPQIEVV